MALRKVREGDSKVSALNRLVTAVNGLLEGGGGGPGSQTFDDFDTIEKPGTYGVCNFVDPLQPHGPAELYDCPYVVGSLIMVVVPLDFGQEEFVGVPHQTLSVTGRDVNGMWFAATYTRGGGEGYTPWFKVGEEPSPF